MKKNYEMPIIEVYELETHDVLTSSAEVGWPWGEEV